MATVYQRLKVPYSAEQMFDLVVDIERYPKFVPGWRAVRITERGGDREQGWLHVDQVIADKGIRFRFDTDARYTRPTYLRISANGRPFQYFVLRWQFRPLDDGGCEVIAHARYRLRNVPLRHLAEKYFSQTFNTVVSSFADRAKRLYGGPSGAERMRKRA
jgi:coenzyme Q-binding protein COQ10